MSIYAQLAKLDLLYGTAQIELDDAVSQAQKLIAEFNSTANKLAKESGLKQKVTKIKLNRYSFGKDFERRARL